MSSTRPCFRFGKEFKAHLSFFFFFPFQPDPEPLGCSFTKIIPLSGFQI